MSDVSSVYYAQREFMRVRKFDLVLEDSHGNEYDGTGCLPCLPWCRKPIYTPGQHITGYVLIRPTRKFVITGVKILFEGVYQTEWCEGSLKWIGHRSFYIDCVNLIQRRNMELDCKWYRFDFEHVLPRSLIPSFKAKHCKIIYSATGLVTQINMPDLQTLETHFTISGPMDIKTLPQSYHQPISKSANKSYEITDMLNRIVSEHGNIVTMGRIIENHHATKSSSSVMMSVKKQDCSTNSISSTGSVSGSQCNINTYSNNNIAVGHSSTSIVSFNEGGRGVGLGSGENILPPNRRESTLEIGENEHNQQHIQQHCCVSASVWVNKQVFIPSEELVVEVYVDNGTPATFEAHMYLQQVLLLKPTYAFNRRTSEYVPVRSFPKKTISTLIKSLWRCDVIPQMAETNSVIYTIPTLHPNISSYTNSANVHTTPVRNLVGSKEPLIKLKYFLKLDITPKFENQVTDSKRTELISLELNIGNWDSGLDNLTLSNSGTVLQSSQHVEEQETTISPNNRTRTRQINRPLSELPHHNNNHSRTDNMQICGSSEVGLLDNIDGGVRRGGGHSGLEDDEAVTEGSGSHHGPCRYTPETEGPPAYSHTPEEEFKPAQENKMQKRK